jgi:hypothetical protein
MWPRSATSQLSALAPERQRGWQRVPRQVAIRKIDAVPKPYRATILCIGILRDFTRATISAARFT